MPKNKKYHYGKAEADLYDAGCRNAEEIYDYSSEKGFRAYMKEHGLNPDKYIRSEGKRESHDAESNSDGCYLTTACVEAKGLPDDCNELRTLRIFRDTYLAKLPGGRNEIDQYYQMAPAVVAAVNKHDNRAQIWDQVYAELIVPCVRMIREQDNEKAHQLYKSYSLELRKKYCS